MAEWEDVSLNIPAIEALDFAANAARTASRAAAPVASASAAVLRAISTFQQSQDVVQDVVNEAVEALDDVLADFLDDSAGHALFIPPIPPFRRRPERPTIPVRRLADLVYTAELVRGPVADLAGDGGNYGLYRKFVESLFDAGDYARPSYNADAYIGGVIIVFGNTTFAETLRGMLTLDNFLGGALNIRPDNYEIPVPQNVKARPIATPDTELLSGIDVVAATQVPGAPKIEFSREFLPFTQPPKPPAKFAVRVSWDRPEILRLRVDFGPYVYQLKKWHVYVKKGSRIARGENLNDYEQYALDIPSLNYSRVAGGLSTSGDVSANTTGLVVTDLQGDQTYFISAAFTVDVEDTSTGDVFTVTPLVTTLSNQVRVNLAEQAPYRRVVDGIPPDWLALSSPFAIFPGIQDAVRQVRAAVDVVLANYTDYNNEVSGIATSISRVASQVQALADELTGITAENRNIIDGFNIGAYAATFAGQGGIPYLIKTVGDLLLDPSTDNRPPFLNGDEAVSALVLVTGSDTAVGVNKFVRLVGRLFGGGDPDSPGFEGINTIDRVTGPDYDFDIDESADEAPPGEGFEPPVVPSVEDLGIVDEDPC